jgi:hypothetical protein
MPARQGIRVSEHFRVRRDRIDADGKLTLRHNSRLHHIGTGRRWAGTKDRNDLEPPWRWALAGS